MAKKIMKLKCGCRFAIEPYSQEKVSVTQTFVCDDHTVLLPQIINLIWHPAHA